MLTFRLALWCDIHAVKLKHGDRMKIFIENIKFLYLVSQVYTHAQKSSAGYLITLVIRFSLSTFLESPGQKRLISTSYKVIFAQ